MAQEGECSYDDDTEERDAQKCVHDEQCQRESNERRP